MKIHRGRYTINLDMWDGRVSEEYEFDDLIAYQYISKQDCRYFNIYTISIL